MSLIAGRREILKVRAAASLLRTYFRLPAEARREWRLDSRKLAEQEPDADECIAAAIEWLCMAQDCSAFADGGAARHYSLVSGWAPSYPETSGYIIPTLLHCSRVFHRPDLRERAHRMLDWLVSIQFDSGGFPGGTVGADPLVPVTFNTGQILLGLSAGVREFGPRYRKPFLAAADWLEDVQDPDGCWRKHPSPFVEPRENVYDTHAAWGLFEAARVEPRSTYADAALANIRWALRYQESNGWFRNSCLQDQDRPLTHTIGYTLRGVIEAYRFAGKAELLESSCRAADGLLSAMHANGFLPGRLDRNWRGASRWACLTGTVQIAACWFLLFYLTGEERYRDGAIAANRYVRRTIRLEGEPGARGGVKGCYPTFGSYARNEYVNWACKFFIDSSLMEKGSIESMNRRVDEGTVLPKIEQYVRENYLYARPDFVLQPSDSLLQTGIVDSMGVMELVAYIEDEFGVALQDTEITEQNLGSLHQITRCVEAKLAQPQSA